MKKLLALTIALGVASPAFAADLPRHVFKGTGDINPIEMRWDGKYDIAAITADGTVKHFDVATQYNPDSQYRIEYIDSQYVIVNANTHEIVGVAL